MAPSNLLAAARELRASIDANAEKTGGSQHFFASPASTRNYARDRMSASPDSALDA